MAENLVDSVGRKIVGTVLEKLAKHTIKVIKELKKDFEILGEEITIFCPECIQKHSVVFRVKKGILDRKKEFQGKVVGVSLRSIAPLQTMNEAIRILPDGFEVLTKPLSTGEIYILEVEYEIDNPRFIDSLVHRQSSPDTPKGKIREYWMHAQLKHLDIFRKLYNNINLQDLDVLVDVAVHQDVKTSIPKYFKDELETIARWARSVDREEKGKLDRRHIQLRRRKPKVDVFEVLRDLQDLFFPGTFRKFVEVRRDFRYHYCYRGKDFYETLPFPTWPKTMTVISRTNLNFDKPAAEGRLIYKYKDFKKEVEKILKIIRSSN